MEKTTKVVDLEKVVIKFAGDSGDGYPDDGPIAILFG